MAKNLVTFNKHIRRLTTYQDQDGCCISQNTAPRGAVQPEVLQPVERQPEQPAGGHHRRQREHQPPQAPPVAPDLHLVLGARVENHHALVEAEAGANAQVVAEAGKVPLDAAVEAGVVVAVLAVLLVVGLVARRSVAVHHVGLHPAAALI